MKITFYALMYFVCAIHSHAYYQSEQGRWLNRDPIGERGGLNTIAAFDNNPINRLDPYGLTGASQCTHTIRVGHLFSANDGTGNWDHFRSDRNDGSSCYIGCGMNELNRRQGEKFPNKSAGTTPIPPYKAVYTPNSAQIISDNAGYTSVGNNETLVRIANEAGYDGDATTLDTIGPQDIGPNITRKIDEINAKKCSLVDDGGCFVCESASLAIECPHGQVDSRCGTTVKTACSAVGR